MAVNNYPLAKQLGSALKLRDWTLAVAESCTAGGLAQQVTAVEGSSHWFDRGFVTYTNEAKMEMLGVRKDTLEHHGAVSEQVAQEMAQGVIQQSRADIALSITGVAGPGGGTKNKPVGTVWFGLAERNGQCCARLAHFHGGRGYVRVLSVHFALNWLVTTVHNI